MADAPDPVAFCAKHRSRIGGSAGPTKSHRQGQIQKVGTSRPSRRTSRSQQARRGRQHPHTNEVQGLRLWQDRRLRRRPDERAVAPALGLTTDYRGVRLRQDHPVHRRRHLATSAYPRSTDTKEREKQVDSRLPLNAGMVGAKPGADIDPNNACGKRSPFRPPRSRKPTSYAAKSRSAWTPAKPEIQIDQFDGRDAATNAVVLRSEPTRCRRTPQ